MMSPAATETDRETTLSAALCLKKRYEANKAATEAERDNPTLLDGTTQSLVPSAWLVATTLQLADNPHLSSGQRDQYHRNYAASVLNILSAHEYHQGWQTVSKGLGQMLRSDPDSVTVSVQTSDPEARRPMSLKEVKQRQRYETELVEDLARALKILESADPDWFADLTRRKRLKSKL